MAWWVKSWRPSWFSREYRKESARHTRATREREEIAEHMDPEWWCPDEVEGSDNDKEL